VPAKGSARLLLSVNLTCVNRHFEGAAKLLPSNRREIPMPVDAFIMIAIVVAGFATFAGTLAYASLVASKK
jgi:hypothetical protein